MNCLCIDFLCSQRRLTFPRLASMQFFGRFCSIFREFESVFGGDEKGFWNMERDEYFFLTTNRWRRHSQNHRWALRSDFQITTRAVQSVLVERFRTGSFWANLQVIVLSNSSKMEEAKLGIESTEWTWSRKSTTEKSDPLQNEGKTRFENRFTLRQLWQTLFVLIP